LREAFRACREHRARRRRALGLGPDAPARGLGKLLVVAPDQPTAQRYVDVLRGWLPGTGRAAVRLATSDIADAHEAIAAYRLRAEPAVLVTVAMAYEGMDCPEVTHVACLTHIRSRPWLEQMIARATRVDPHGGAYEAQRAVIYHPDDRLFADFRHAIETEQGTRAQAPKRSSRQGELALGSGDADGRGVGLGITPLRSNATALRFDTVAAGPDFAGASDGTGPLTTLRSAAETPSATEHRLRQRIGQMIAAQVIEDEDNHLVPHGPVSYHAYNAVLKRVLGKSRAEMSIAELEAAVGWLERNRLADHLSRLAGDPRYAWSARQRRRQPGRPGRIRMGGRWL
jgi:hypothetical protein